MQNSGFQLFHSPASDWRLTNFFAPPLPPRVVSNLLIYWEKTLHNSYSFPETIFLFSFFLFFFYRPYRRENLIVAFDKCPWGSSFQCAILSRVGTSCAMRQNFFIFCKIARILHIGGASAAPGTIILMSSMSAEFILTFRKIRV